MKNISRLILTCLFCFALLITGCGDDKDIIGVKEGTLSYSRIDNTGIVKKIDGAPTIGKAFDKVFKDAEWKIEEERGKKFIVFNGTIDLIGGKPQKVTLAFLNKGDYYALAGPQRSDVEFALIYIAMKKYASEYDFTRNHIPRNIIEAY